MQIIRPRKKRRIEDPFLTISYMTIAAKDQDLYFGRRFRGGFRLKTLCADCNSKLGASEDKALAKFFEAVRKLVETPILLTTRTVNVFRGAIWMRLIRNDPCFRCVAVIRNDGVGGSNPSCGTIFPIT